MSTRTRPKFHLRNREVYLMGRGRMLLSGAILAVWFTLTFAPVATLAHGPNGPRIGAVLFDGLDVWNNQHITATQLGRKFHLVISIAGRVPIAKYFVEVLGVRPGRGTEQIVWETGDIVPPLLCCMLTIPLQLDEALKWREVEFRVSVKDTRGRVSNSFTHRLFIHD